MVKLNSSTRNSADRSMSIPHILHGKKIVLGITGCIAAYKANLLVREYIRRGAEVKVVMTPSAAEFVTPMTLAALSRNEVIQQIFPRDQKGNVSLGTWHIDLGLWADLMVIAPASVNTVAKLAYGFCDNALTTLAAAMRAKILLCPAADMDMYENPRNRRNLEILEGDGYYVLPAEEGELASGLKGIGRLPEIAKIVEATESLLLGAEKDLTGKHLVVTAGPTFEDIDPVRFIGNRSTGKMGYEIAKAAYLRGATVTLVTGPSSLPVYPEIRTVKVRSASEMLDAVTQSLNGADALIMAAAVADYAPAEYQQLKMKKQASGTTLPLQRTPDILASLRDIPLPKVGFALETDREKENALKKLREKGLTFIALNSLNDPGSGFEVDTNKITLFYNDGTEEALPLAQKFAVAHTLLDRLKKVLPV